MESGAKEILGGLGHSCVQELLRAANQVLDQAREANVSEIQLKILESSLDKLLSIAQSIEEDRVQRSLMI